MNISKGGIKKYIERILSVMIWESIFGTFEIPDECVSRGVRIELEMGCALEGYTGKINVRANKKSSVNDKSSGYVINIRDKDAGATSGGVSKHFCSIKISGGNFHKAGASVFLKSPDGVVETDANISKLKGTDLDKLKYASALLLDNIDDLLLIWRNQVSFEEQEEAFKRIKHNNATKNYNDKKTLSKDRQGQYPSF